jgi:DNA replication protein DnaC
MHRRGHSNLARQQPPNLLQSVAVPPGCGKTHLAVALATLAVEAGYRGYFTTGNDMVRQLLSAQRDGNFAHRLRTYTAPTVLVVDDVGFFPSEQRVPACSST